MSNNFGRDYPGTDFGRDLGGSNFGRELGGTNFGRDYAGVDFGRDYSASFVKTYLDKVKAIRPGSLVGSWPLSDPFGTVATDASGNGLHGTYNGVTLQQPGIGDERTSTGFDGVNDYVVLPSASLDGPLDPTLGTMLIWAQLDAASWLDITTRRFFSCRVNASNAIAIRRGAAAGQISFDYIAGGTSDAFSYTTDSPLTPFSLALTWNKAIEVVIGYFRGMEVGRSTGLGVWAGAFASCLIGATTSTPTSPFLGNLAHAALLNADLTPAEIATIGVL